MFFENSEKIGRRRLEDPYRVIVRVCITWPRQWEKARNPKARCFLSKDSCLSFLPFSLLTNKQTNPSLISLSLNFWELLSPPALNSFTPQFRSTLKIKKIPFLHNSATSTLFFIHLKNTQKTKETIFVQRKGE